MSRVQDRLFEKQLRQFTETFSRFTDYQLEKISELIIDLIIQRRKEKLNENK